MEIKQHTLTILIVDRDRFMVQGIKSVIATIWGEEASHFSYIYNTKKCQSADITILSFQALLMSDRPLEAWFEITSKKLIIISDKSANHRHILPRTESVATLIRMLTSCKPHTSQLQQLTSKNELGLSPLQKQIVRQLASGLRHRAIAQALNINEKSVSYHKQSIMAKLRIDTKAEFNRWIVSGKEI